MVREHSEFSKGFVFMPFRMDPLDPLASGLIVSKVKELFSHIFKDMKCQIPYINNTHLYIPFQWDTKRSGIMTFSITDTIIFDPFLSKPYQFEGFGIDWIKLAYLDKEPAIGKLQVYIRGLRIFDTF